MAKTFRHANLIDLFMRKVLQKPLLEVPNKSLLAKEIALKSLTTVCLAKKASVRQMAVKEIRDLI